MNTIYLVWWMDFSVDRSVNVKMVKAFYDEVEAMKYSDDLDKQFGRAVTVYVDAIEVVG